MSLICFVPLDQTPNIKMCHMVASEHRGLIEGRRRLIATDIIDSDEASGDAYIDNDGASLDEEDGSG